MICQHQKSPAASRAVIFAVYFPTVSIAAPQVLQGTGEVSREMDADHCTDCTARQLAA
jgi:hypothetical protein